MLLKGGAARNGGLLRRRHGQVRRRRRDARALCRLPDRRRRRPRSRARAATTTPLRSPVTAATWGCRRHDPRADARIGTAAACRRGAPTNCAARSSTPTSSPTARSAARTPRRVRGHGAAADREGRPDQLGHAGPLQKDRQVPAELPQLPAPARRRPAQDFRLQRPDRPHRIRLAGALAPRQDAGRCRRERPRPPAPARLPGRASPATSPGPRTSKRPSPTSPITSGFIPCAST
jgi:hypothetical protein